LSIERFWKASRWSGKAVSPRTSPRRIHFGIGSGMTRREMVIARENAASVWSYPADVRVGARDLAGYRVEASDGRIGKIDSNYHTTGKAYLVLRTGSWICRTSRIIPAGAVQRIDHTARKVHLQLTKKQIAAAPHTDERERPWR